MFQSSHGQRCIGKITNLGEHYNRGTALLLWLQKRVYAKSLRFELSYQKGFGAQGLKLAA